MKVVLAIDSFKGSLTSIEAAEAASRGILTAIPCAEISVCPIADGGEGTTEAIIAATGGVMRNCEANDPLGRKVTARYGYIPSSGTAVMEMSAAAGITLVAPEERNPLLADTYGVGEMIKHAIDSGVRRFIIGIGGSATNDGGVGMLSALGFGFYKADGSAIERGAIGLSELQKIDTGTAIPELRECSFRVACDVRNPLCGKNGASHIYGEQKGADEKMRCLLDSYLERYACLTESLIPTADKCAEGAGAAGGLGFALLSYLGAEMSPGIELVTEVTGLEEKIKLADVVVTGEGRLDGQSIMGKVPVGVSRLAMKHGRMCIALAGSVTDDATKLHEYGIDAFFPIIPSPTTLADAMKPENAKKNLARAAEQAFRLIKRRFVI